MAQSSAVHKSDGSCSAASPCCSYLFHLRLWFHHDLCALGERLGKCGRFPDLNFRFSGNVSLFRYYIGCWPRPITKLHRGNYCSAYYPCSGLAGRFLPVLFPGCHIITFFLGNESQRQAGLVVRKRSGGVLTGGAGFMLFLKFSRPAPGGAACMPAAKLLKKSPAVSRSRCGAGSTRD
jgi:hypothetical protein